MALSISKGVKMIVLGIETSCDETAVAIVTGDRQVLAHELYSQVQEHQAASTKHQAAPREQRGATWEGRWS